MNHTSAKIWIYPRMPILSNRNLTYLFHGFLEARYHVIMVSSDKHKIGLMGMSIEGITLTLGDHSSSQWQR